MKNTHKKSAPRASRKKPDSLTSVEWQRELRKLFVADGTKSLIIKNFDGAHKVFGDYTVSNSESGKTYKIALRSKEGGMNFCTCLDFKTNMLGTCKHIEFVLLTARMDKKKTVQLNETYRPTYSSLYLKYGARREVMLRIGENAATGFKALAQKYFDSECRLLTESYGIIDQFLNEAATLSPNFRCYPDALEFILSRREDSRRKKIVEKLLPDVNSVYFDRLLKAKLYRYQKEGIMFAVRAGRAIIADEMGLGKTLQAIGVAEFLRKEFSITKILIICPTSLKYQWQNELERFTGELAKVVEGSQSQRSSSYALDTHYTITNYNVIGIDAKAILQMEPDMVILDEAQRIKNWQTETARQAKKIQSKYALVLTGTPIENKLEELYSIVQFIDPFKLGALYRFLEAHHVTDDSGKVIGYRNLNYIRKELSDTLIRRTKKEIETQLPERSDKNILVPLTKAQADAHFEFGNSVARLVEKWKRIGFLDEKDRQRLLTSLNCMRMVCDSTYILDEESRNDTKIAELMGILDDYLNAPNQKAVVFSQWERMTRLVGKELEMRNVRYAYLHGGIPSKKRKALLDTFHTNDYCRIFLSTDAGGVGLNLQNASLVINIDLPWNPAVLEQRIGRVHRHGQKRPVQVINLISKDSIEERMLDVLKFKSSLFSGALDGGEDSIFMGESKFKRFMSSVEKVAGNKNRQTVILPDAAVPKVSADINESVIKPMSNALQKMGFFSAITSFFSNPKRAEQTLSSLIKTDATGKRRIVFPRNIEQSVLSVIDSLLAFLRKPFR